MAVQVLTAARVLVGESDLTASATSIATDVTVNMVDCTTFASAGFTECRPGMLDASFGVNGYADFVDPGTTKFVGTLLGTQQTAQISVPGSTGGDPVWLASGRVETIQPFGGNVGEMVTFGVTLRGVNPPAQGKMLIPVTALTVAGLTSTGVAVTGPTVTQRLYAALNVTAAAGTNLVVKVQSSATQGGAYTDRITFSTLSATGSEWKSVAGAITDGWWRVLITVASGTFSAAVSVGVVG